ISWAKTYAGLLRASAAVLQGDTERALAQFGEAAAAAEAGEMRLHAEVARLRRGELLGGQEGRELVDAALAWMAGQKIVRPDRLAEMLSPIGVDHPQRGATQAPDSSAPRGG